MRGFPLQFVLTVVLLAACAACTASPPQGAVESSPTAPQLAAAGLCTNSLFPVVQGATWTYSSSGANGQPYRFTDTITEVRPDGFTLSSQFSDVTRTQEWSCRTEGLVALQLGSGPAGALSASGMKFELATSNVTGVTIPATVSAGQTWTYGLDFTGTMDVEDATVDATGTLAFNLNASGMESVSVPAGTFDAMKVLITGDMNSQATYKGITIPVLLTANSTVWYAPGIGWVKMENSGDLQGMQFSETITLESYNIP